MLYHRIDQGNWGCLFSGKLSGSIPLAQQRDCTEFQKNCSEAATIQLKLRRFKSVLLTKARPIATLWLDRATLVLSNVPKGSLSEALPASYEFAAQLEEGVLATCFKRFFGIIYRFNIYADRARIWGRTPREIGETPPPLLFLKWWVNGWITNVAMKDLSLRW